MSRSAGPAHPDMSPRRLERLGGMHMKRKSARRLALLLPVLALAWPPAGPVAAQTSTPAPAVAAQDAPPLEPAAMETLKRMSDLLKGAKSFTFTYRTAREQQAQTGQMVDFLHLNTVTLVRPNKLRLELTGEI